MAADVTLSPNSEVLILEDDAPLRKRFAAYLRSLGASVTEAARLEETRRLLATLRYDYALVDLHLPDGEVLGLLREGRFSENTTVVVMTAYGGVKQAVEAIRLGAADYLAKPFELEAIPLAFVRSRQQRHAARREEFTATGTAGREELFFGASLAPLRTQLDTILAADARVGTRLPPILIEGETGTGKSVLARWIHQQGPRAPAPWLSVNCAALPDTLAESELFGHERGAFTDAKTARLGLFEAADGGTLFLDEITALSPAIQAKVLVALEEGTIRRLGGTRTLPVDVRIIAASNTSMNEAVTGGKFRADLFHRLDLLRLRLPPLRERGADLLPMADHLLGQIAARHRLPHASISADGQQRLQAQAWPGNVRELAHEIERAVIFHGAGPLDFAELGPVPVESQAPAAWRNPAWRLPAAGFSLEAATNEFIVEALRETDGNVTAAARRLGVTRDFLRYRLGQPQKGASPISGV
jgi:DNA-binding NtrC family response regulator